MLVQVAPRMMKETNNPLLVKAEIGKPLKRGFTLPPANFTYGKSSQGKMSGCAEALANWNSTVTSLHVSDKKPQRDFIRLNKAATTSGLVTAQEHAQYRATHEIVRDISASKEGSAPLRRLPPTMVFGIPTKPSTPVFDLLEHKYQDRWLNERQKAELSRLRREEAQAKSSKSRSYCETRASKLRRYSPPVDPPPLWQMSKFKKRTFHLMANDAVEDDHEEDDDDDMLITTNTILARH